MDDDPIIRKSISLTVRRAGYESYPFISGSDLIEASTYLTPGCILLDIHMPGLNGLYVLDFLRQGRPDMPVIIMTGHGDVPKAVSAIKGGAIDFIEKPFEDDLLLQMLRQAFSTLESYMDREDRVKAAQARLDRLSAREHEVLSTLLEGKTNRLIANQLGLSVRTVEMHRGNLMHKLRVGNLAEAAQVVFIAGRSTS